VIIGASVVFLFAGLAIMAVGRAAGRVVEEVRNQFREHPGIMDYTEQPDYGRVVDICTQDAQRELATPGLLAILTPIAVGFGLGYAPLGAFLAGAIAAGTLMAVFLSNAGGAWDNAKKVVEEGALGGKGSDAHAATVIGDTVGDPFKDTAGPAINPLIKVMNLVSLLIAQAVVTYADNTPLRIGVAIVAVGIVVASIIISKRRASALSSGDGGGVAAIPVPRHPEVDAGEAKTPEVQGPDVPKTPKAAEAEEAPDTDVTETDAEAANAS
ncbi:MAG TPA: sodium/proton-translocating pyrophosphatase, partial [Streptosporangiaceae bacterium]|nr:sodium/proton-translocating pyrophosphatase [Streptosporangiaceae bacterium]